MHTESMLTLNETAAVAGVAPTLVRKEVERRVVEPRRNKAHLMFSEEAPLYFALLAEIDGDLDVAPKGRRELFRLLTGSSSRSTRWERGENFVALKGRTTVKFDTTVINAELATRLRLLRERNERIHSDPEIKQGVPVFAGTRIPVDNVRGQLARGASVDELVEDYPTLTRDNVLLAELLNRLGKPPGRPKKFKPLQIRRV